MQRLHPHKQKTFAVKKVLSIVVLFFVVFGLVRSFWGNLQDTTKALDVTETSLGRGLAFGGTEVTLHGDFQVSQIAAGEYHTCAIDADGKAYCWGSNSSGQLGNGTNTRSRVPVAVDVSGALAGKLLARIYSGGSYTCAIASDGKAYCWGGNSSGQLGNGTTSGSNVPVAVDTSGVLADKKLVTIVGDDYHACAIDSDGAAYCWGQNTMGQLGDGSTSSSNVPVAVDVSGVLAGKMLVDIAVGYTHTCAIDSDGAAYCWGDGGIGRLGTGSRDSSAVPVAVDVSGALAGKTLTDIAVDDGYACALDSEGMAYCWGWNQYGQFGNGQYANSLVPTAMDTSDVLAGKTLTRINAGMAHACGIDTDGRAYCWGFNGYGQLGSVGMVGGIGVIMQSLSPLAVDVSGVLADKVLTRISTGSYHTCALDSDGKVYCWGSGSDGQLGNNSTMKSNVPVNVHTTADADDTPAVSQLPHDTATPAYRVVFDANGVPAECTDVVVNIHHTVLDCVTGAHPAGVVDIEINDGVSQTILPGAFEYYANAPNTGYGRN